MNPFTINPLAALIAAALIAATGFGAGWQTNGWRLNGQIAETKAATADEARQRAETAVTDMAAAAQKVNDAAGGARVDVARVLEKLSAIDRRYKDAKPTPLPPDCAPDAVRVRYLTEAAAAANSAITGPEPSR